MNDGSSHRPVSDADVQSVAPRLCLTLLALVLAACGGGGAEEGAARPAQGVLHLDPRLADGRSSAVVLAEQPTAVTH